MRFSLRIFLGYFLIVVAGGSYLFSIVRNEVQPTVRQSAEEVLVDTANLLAELIRDDFLAGRLDSGTFERAVLRYADRRPGATIWDVRKDTVDLRVYVTDQDGVVRLDSSGTAVGQDFSRWRDVYLALRGQYGARSSKGDFGQGVTTVMHVAAPILENGQIVGVVTVAKPNYTMQPYIDRTYARLAQGAALVIGLGLLLGGLFSWWLSHGIGRVTAYADAVAAGQPAVVPVLPGNRELRRLAAAVAHMRERLEGKAYVEEYVYGLTHELKSPLAGIRASAEVLAEPLEPAEQARFAAHIESEAQRLDRIVQRLLELARVEQRTATEPTERVDLAQVVAGVAAALRPQAEARGIGMEVTVPGGAEVPGERFLLEQAVRNLWQNALDFSPPGSIVRVGASRENGTWVLAVADEGPGIPEYAVGRIFERFYSLPRPGGGARGTGLGLPLVASIARLHGGAVSVANRESGGVIAQLRLPA